MTAYRRQDACAPKLPELSFSPTRFYHHHTLVPLPFRRIQEMSRLCLLSLLLLLTITPTVAGQAVEPRKPVSPEIARARDENDTEAERLLRERRANAQSLLISLAADAATYT